ncbi:MAG: ABC transporter substrate-binding protein [Clostridia bacterium]|nr:ABC transporter substrate-binding protein [Clostridia bacterium]
MKKHYLILILVFCMAITLLFAGCNTKAKTTDITFVLDWTPNTNHTGVYVAQALGYFEEAGLKVTIAQPPEDGAEMLVATGRAQFGISFQDNMAEILSGDNKLPITAVAAVIQHNTSGIMSRKGEGVTSPKGMEGKQYATWQWSIEQAIIKNVVEKDGGDYSKITMLPVMVTDEISALKTGTVDCLWIYYAWAGVATQVNNYEIDYFAFKDINPVFDYYTPVIIANNEYLENSPETAAKFMEAVSKGYKYACENPEKAADILCEAVPELDIEHVRASQKWLSDKYIDDAPKWGYIDGQRWNSFYTWLEENQLIANDIPENAGFTNDFLP